MNIKIKADHALNCEPVFIKIDGELPEKINSVHDGDGHIFPAQKFGGGIVVIAELDAGTNTDFTLSGDTCGNGGAEIIQKIDSLDIVLSGKRFSSYVWSDKFAKPYFGAVETSFGLPFTRLDFKTKEHPHHRSIFLGVGDVSLGDIKNVDFWNEPENCGVQKHTALRDVSCGEAFARFTTDNIWCDAYGHPMADESRTFTVYNQPCECRCTDIEFTFTASYGDIIFGETKEAGPLGIRMNDILRADRGGHIANSYGARGERECWGRCAHWCDYSGTLEGHSVGITVFDDERNERFPTAWHIRDYGLFAANNLYFRGGLTIKHGESLTYRYRIIFREGDISDSPTDRYIIYSDIGHSFK